MTMARFSYQRFVLTAFTEPGDTVLNVGANNDPGRLKADHPDRNVINCDREHSDIGLGYEIEADAYFDCTKLYWPFEDNSAELVILGDIIEHLPPGGAGAALNEAARVAPYVCITVPQDARILERDTDPSDGKPWQHLTVVSCAMLHHYLAIAELLPLEFLTVDYEFVPRGYFVVAQRYSEAMLDISAEYGRVREHLRSLPAV